MVQYRNRLEDTTDFFLSLVVRRTFKVIFPWGPRRTRPFSRRARCGTAPERRARLMNIVSFVLETLAALSAAVTILDFILDEWRLMRDKRKRDDSGD